MIPFHSLHVTLKQDYLHFIHFHSFPFLTSNQGYLIPFHSLMIIPFHSLMNSQTKPKNPRPLTQGLNLSIMNIMF